MVLGPEAVAYFAYALGRLSSSIATRGETCSASKCKAVEEVEVIGARGEMGSRTKIPSRTGREHRGRYSWPTSSGKLPATTQALNRGDE